MRRATLAGLVGAFCQAVESYMYLSASKRLRFLYVTNASTRDLVSPRRWIVDEIWETCNDTYCIIGVCTMATVCGGALTFGSLALQMAMPIQKDIEIPQAIETRTDTRYITGPAQNTSNVTFLAKIRRSGLRIQASISKAHLRR